MAGERFGKDLDLGFLADEEAWVVAGPSTQVDLQARRTPFVRARARADLGVVDGVMNLVQSLIVRLMTEQGELAALGYPEYGSRHHALVGEPNSEGNRSLVKLHILTCLRQEPRVEVIRVDVRPIGGLADRDRVVIDVQLRARDEPNPLNLVVPFSFGGTFA